MVNVEKIKINEIKPSPYNPRCIDNREYNQLRENLNHYGLVDPIIINTRNNHIIGGHQRYKILLEQDPQQELNMIQIGDIAWIYNQESLTIKDDNEEKALNLALNKISGDWDYIKLEPLLVELDNSPLDTNLTGFTDIELENITSINHNNPAPLTMGEDNPLTMDEDNIEDDYDEVIDNNQETQFNQDIDDGIDYENTSRIFLKWGNCKVPLTSDENELLSKKYEEFLLESPVNYGFVVWLLK